MKANNRGFTLIEVILATTLLLIIVMAVSPVFVSILRAYHFNQSRIAASNVAMEVLEELRYDIVKGDYDAIGTKDGNPTGSIEQQEYKTIGGRSFQINTDISWEDETVNGNTVYNAYKKAEVTIHEVNNVTDKEKIGPEVTHSTLIAREGERPFSDEGSILVEASRGTNGLQENVLIILSSSNILQSGYTDEEGKKIFADLDPDNYTISADPSSEGLMLVPEAMNGSNFNITWDYYNEIDNIEINEFSKVSKFFSVDWPQYINLNLVEENGNILDLNKYSSGLNFSLEFPIYNPITDIEKDYEIKKNITQQSDFDELKNIKLWPRSNYNIIIKDLDTGHIFNLNNIVDPDKWDGTFQNVDNTETFDLNLKVAGSVSTSPAPGGVSSGTEITLIPEPNDFDIYYTTDGSDPDLTSPIYDNNNKETVTGNLTIKAFAYKDGYLLGPVKTFDYNIN